mmetsp:Transcript_14484/g.26044  ORF Transcript_14484/g.26044 Transcript_14484/m.26044 type:complete len:241 (-) Transcript_14484:202-924(-)
MLKHNPKLQHLNWSAAAAAAAAVQTTRLTSPPTMTSTSRRSLESTHMRTAPQPKQLRRESREAGKPNPRQDPNPNPNPKLRRRARTMSRTQLAMRPASPSLLKRRSGSAPSARWKTNSTPSTVWCAGSRSRGRRPCSKWRSSCRLTSQMRLKGPGNLGKGIGIGIGIEIGEAERLLVLQDWVVTITLMYTTRTSTRMISALAPLLIESRSQSSTAMCKRSSAVRPSEIYGIIAKNYCNVA